MASETETKLIVNTALDLPNLDGLVDAVVASPPVESHLHATYFDTPDLRLARFGVTLRHRTGDGERPWTLKLPERAAGVTLARSEITCPGDEGTIPMELLDLTRAYARGEALGPVLEMTTVRQTILLSSAGAVVAELVDDAVTGGGGERFREIEVEAKGEAKLARMLQRKIAGALEAAGVEPTPPLPKAVRLLGPPAQGDPDVVVPRVRKRSTGHELIQSMIARSALQLLRSDAGVRLGADPEALHQFRVAIRRLRSDLHSFAHYLDKDWVGALRADLRELGHAVGGARDADVMCERIAKLVDALPEQDQAGGHRLLAKFDARRERARAHALAAMRTPGYDDLVQRLVDAARAPWFAADQATALNRPARALASKVVGPKWRKIAKAVNRLSAESPDHELHQIRILAKRCRYAADAVAPVQPDARRFAGARAEIQTLLGDHHDAVVAEEWIRECSAPNNALAAGALIATERHNRGSLRSDWSKQWKRSSRKSVRRWL